MDGLMDGGDFIYSELKIICFCHTHLNIHNVLKKNKTNKIVKKKTLA